MYIYQVCVSGGQYEDSYNFIVGTYINGESAEKHKAYLLNEQEKLIKQRKACYECDSPCEDKINEYRYEFDERYYIEKTEVLTSFMAQHYKEMEQCRC